MKNLKLNLFSGSDVFQLRLPCFVCWNASPIILIVLNYLALMFNTKFVEDSTNKPAQTSIFTPLLLLTEISSNRFVEATISETPETDPFFYLLSLMSAGVYQVCGFFINFILFIGLCSMLIYIYNYILNSLKTFIDNKKMEHLRCSRVLYHFSGTGPILKWCLSVVVSITLILLTVMRVRAICFRTFEVITIINYNYFHICYYNPPGLSMGKSRVLHLADYSQIFTYFNLEYINPEYILTYITFIKYFFILIIATLFYLSIAYFTTMIYSQDKTALSLPNGPASLNLFTKCFYFKSQQAFIYSLLRFFAILFILMVLTAFVLYHYINIYHIG